MGQTTVSRWWTLETTQCWFLMSWEQCHRSQSRTNFMNESRLKRWERVWLPNTFWTGTKPCSSDPGGSGTSPSPWSCVLDLTTYSQKTMQRNSQRNAIIKIFPDSASCDLQRLLYVHDSSVWFRSPLACDSTACLSMTAESHTFYNPTLSTQMWLLKCRGVRLPMFEAHR